MLLRDQIREREREIAKDRVPVIIQDNLQELLNDTVTLNAGTSTLFLPRDTIDRWAQTVPMPENDLRGQLRRWLVLEGFRIDLADKGFYISWGRDTDS